MVTCIFNKGFVVASCKFKGSRGRLCMLRVRVARPFVGVKFRALCFFHRVGSSQGGIGGLNAAVSLS